jgi:hypothetical protein
LGAAAAFANARRSNEEKSTLTAQETIAEQGLRGIRRCLKNLSRTDYFRQRDFVLRLIAAISLAAVISRVVFVARFIAFRSGIVGLGVAH